MRLNASIQKATFEPRPVLRFSCTMCNTQRHRDLELQDLGQNASQPSHILQLPQAAYLDSSVQRRVDLRHQEGSQTELLDGRSLTHGFGAGNFGSMLTVGIWKDLQSKCLGLQVIIDEYRMILQPSSSPFNVNFDLPRSALPVHQRAGQCCFICFQTKDRGSFAIKVPCLRPTKPRRVTWKIRYRNSNVITKYEEPGPTDNAVECDSDIYRRIKQTTFHQYGDWTRYLPFYGIKDVQEVEAWQNPFVK